MSPTQVRRWNWLWLAATIIAGGVWGVLLGRVSAELWRFPQGETGCWAWSPFLTLGLALGGAIALPLVLKAKLRLPDGRTMFARSWPLALGAIYLFQPAAEPLWAVGALVAGLGGYLWLAWRGRERASLKAEWLCDLLAFVFPLTLYLWTLAPSVLPGDSGEFQFVTAILGIPHPTGYPLYLILGKAFSLLPIRSVAFRLNLLSAFAAGGAVWAIYRAGRALGLRRAPSLVGAACLMVSETFWSQATIAEKYALNSQFVATTLWLGLKWRSERMAGRSARGWLSAWALCYGLSLTHHRTMVLLAPAFLWLLWSTDRSAFRWRSSLRLLLIALAPLSLYLLLPLLSALDPPYAYLRIDSLQSFWDLVLARTYQSGLFRDGWAALTGRIVEFGRLLARQFGPVGLGLGIAGWAALAWRDRCAAWALLAGIVAQVGFALNYYVPNTYVYYLPAYVWLAPCVAAAVDAALRGLEGLRAEQEEGDRPSAVSSSEGGLRAALDGLKTIAWPHLALMCILGVAAVPIALCIARWPGMDQVRAYASLSFDHAYGEMALRSVEADATVVSDWLPATVLWYAQFVDGLAPSVRIIVVDSLEWQWQGWVDDALATGRSVYLARPLMAAGDRYPLSSAGPLVQVLPEPRTSPPPLANLLDADLEGKVRLLGYDWLTTAPGPEGTVYSPPGRRIAGGSTLYVTLYWQATRALAGDYAVTIRLLDSASYVRLERQNRHPVGGTYPTSRWQVGEVVADAYALTLPPHLPSGEYRIQATMGVPFAESGLRDEHGQDALALGTFSVRKPRRWTRSALSIPVRKLLGNGLVLMGYEAPQQAVPGETVSVAVQWLVCGDLQLARPSLVLVGRDGTESVVAPLPGSLEDWKPGALIVEQYTFAVPKGLARIEVRGRPAPILDAPSRHRLRVRVTSAPPPVANFGDQIRLRSYAYESVALRPGDTMYLALEWEAVRAMEERYKVFVHILGPSGLPLAQQDNEPVNGTYPTTRWHVGERVSDSYAIPLPAHLPPGEYPVEVGLYRIADLSRLPVLGEDRSVVDDKLFLAPLVVQ